jgi:hypothetical protein
MKSKIIPFEILEDAECLDNLPHDEFIIWQRKKQWSYHLHSCKLLKQLEKNPDDKIIMSRLNNLRQSLTTLKVILKNRYRKEVESVQGLN